MLPLIFFHSLGGPPATVLEQIVEDYNRDHITEVKIISIDPKQYGTAAIDALARPIEERPNFILVPEYLTGKMQEALNQGVLVSVSQLLEEDRRSDIAEIVRRTFGVDCLPFNPACGVLYMNKTLLEMSGFDKDWQPSSIEELELAAELIKEKTGVDNGYTCAWPESYLVETFLAQQNRSLLDERGDYNFIQLKAHILDLRRQVRDHVFLPPNTGNYDPTRIPFIQSRVPFYMQGSGHFGLIEQEAKEAGFEVGYAPLPTLSRDQKTKYAFPLGGAAIWVFNPQTADLKKSSTHQSMTQQMMEGVKSFLNYLASTQVQARWHLSTAYVPVSKSVQYELAEVYKTKPLFKAVVDQTINAPLGENSFGVKKENYYLVRPKLYPLIRELLLLEGYEEEASKIIEERLNAFQEASNQLEVQS